MAKKSEKVDGLLSQVYSEFSGIGQEIQFLQSAFGFLNRRSNFLSKPGVSKQVQQLLHQYIDEAKKIELLKQEQNKKESKPEIKPDKPITTDDTKNNNDKTKNEETKKKDEEEASDDEEVKDRPKGNGGKTDKYVWTQTLKEVEIKLDIKPTLRARNLDVKIKRKSIYVGIKNNNQFGTEILKGELHDEIDEEESTWTLDQEHGKDTKTLTIILYKEKDKTWWSRVIVGDAEIDTKKIEPESSKLDDLDDETRQTVEKMMYDQRQKMMGKPTSKEMEQQAILEKFKAQHPEMDFSNVKFG